MNSGKIEESSNIMKICKGIFFSFIVTLISIFIFSVILTYTNVSEKIIPIVLIMITFISILIGTMIGIRRIKRRGMLNGAIIGGVYITLIYLISSILNTGFSLNIYTFFMIIAGIISGVIGGIVIVNI